MTDYDDLYAETPHALGDATPAIAACWTYLPPAPLKVLDVGCGQGRDALPLAQLGHSVTGIDPAPSGVAQMCAEAEAEGLDITGHVTDAETYKTLERYDLLLIDRTLHMILNDAERAKALAHLLGFMAPQGYVLIADEPSNMAGLRAVLNARPYRWHQIKETRNMLFWQAQPT